MTKVLESLVKENTRHIGIIKVQLPIPEFSVLSHVANINYCLRQLNKYAKALEKPVVGYNLAQSLGTVELNHAVLPLETAKEKRKANPNFYYYTLESLQREKEKVDQGRYFVRKGLIIGEATIY